LLHQKDRSQKGRIDFGRRRLSSDDSEVWLEECGSWAHFIERFALRITGKKYFVLYRSQAKNISYSTSGSLVFPDHRQKIFCTLPITGNKYFVLYSDGLGRGIF
jgi:hypothetical protein